jgi:hypothetical protein
MSRTPVISIPVLGSFFKNIQRTVGGFQVFGKKIIRIKEPEVLGWKFKPASSLTFVFVFAGSDSRMRSPK